MYFISFDYLLCIGSSKGILSDKNDQVDPFDGRLKDMIYRGSKNSIGYFEEVLTAQQCRDLISFFESSQAKRPGQVYGADGQRKESEDKLSTDLDLDESAGELLRQLHQAVSEAFNAFAADFPVLAENDFQITGYKIQHYRQGEGKFVWHADATTPATFHHQVALVLYLNSVNEGGETSFFHQKLDVPPRQGCMLLFPTFWTHLHCGQVPKSEDKYIISSFFQPRPT